MDEEIEMITLMLESARNNLNHYSKLVKELEQQLKEALE